MIIFIDEIMTDAIFQQKIPDNKVIAEMFAKIVDTNFKPTSFAENRGQKIPEKPAR